MQELGILIVLIGLFLFLPLIRPFIKGLWGISGLNWLPPLGLGIIIGLFAAFGFRPECVPLFMYTLIINLTNIPALVHPENDDFLERGVVFTFTATVLLLLTSGAALYFLPREDTALSDGAAHITLRDQERDRDYYIRLYSGGSGGQTGMPARPLMLVIPPVIGSVTMTDRLCEALAERGFTVISYSRRGLDSPAVGEGDRIYKVPVKDQAALLETFLLGTKSVRANRKGRALEEERKEDIRFLLSALEGELQNRLPKADCIFIAAYGAGGAALAGLSANRGFAAAHPLLRGIIAVESPILSALEGEAGPAGSAGGPEHWLGGLWNALKTRINGFKGDKITRIAGLSRPVIPALFLVSDRIQNPQDRDGRYATVLRAFHGTERPSILAAVPGAGPLDYSDGPEKYPFYRILFPGIKKDIWKNHEFAGNSASLMANFTAMVLTEEEAGTILPRRTGLSRDIYIETGGTWNLSEGDYILGL
jgi:hypothetical protein